MTGRHINNNIDNENEKVKNSLTVYFSKFPLDSVPTRIKLLYYSCACAFLEHVKQLIERNRDMIKLMIVASNNIKNLAIYEDKETFKKEFLNIVLSKYKLNIDELLLFLDLGIHGTDFRYEDVVKMSAELFIEMLLLRSILEEEGSNYKFNVYKFLFEPGYIYDIFKSFSSFNLILNKKYTNLYRKFIINSVELAYVVADVFKLCVYKSTSEIEPIYYIGNKLLNVFIPIKKFNYKSYKGKKYLKLLERLNVVLSMFFKEEKNIFATVPDLKYFKRRLLHRKGKNNEKFISELSAKVDSVINKLIENTKN